MVLTMQISGATNIRITSGYKYLGTTIGNEEIISALLRVKVDSGKNGIGEAGRHCTHTGKSNINDIERKLFALPARLGGFDIRPKIAD